MNSNLHCGMPPTLFAVPPLTNGRPKRIHSVLIHAVIIKARDRVFVFRALNRLAHRGSFFVMSRRMSRASSDGYVFWLLSLAIVCLLCGPCCILQISDADPRKDLATRQSAYPLDRNAWPQYPRQSSPPANPRTPSTFEAAPLGWPQLHLSQSCEQAACDVTLVPDKLIEGFAALGRLTRLNLRSQAQSARKVLPRCAQVRQAIK